jgi:3-dehydroquinate dehydratase/shikimate dehydrogenase
MTNKIAASLALPDTETCLITLQKLASRVAMAEIRLDLMHSFDLPRLIRRAPCPLIITCRSQREGGQFRGTENERLRILLQAIDLGCNYIDIEWESAPQIQRYRQLHTPFIVSRHWHDQIPADLWTTYEQLQEMGDVVKLAGMATRLADILPVLALMRRVSHPVIAIAMGQKGQLTRLLAPRFSSCLLTYAAPTAATITAPGQLSVDEMISLYGLQTVNAETPVHLHLCPDPRVADIRLRQKVVMDKRNCLSIPIVISSRDDYDTLSLLRTYLPDLTITADPLLEKVFGMSQGNRGRSIC